MTSSDPALTGEAKLKKRRAAFLRYLAIALAVSVVVGLASGALASTIAMGAVPNAVMIGVLVVVVAGFSWFTRDYFRRIDEVDLQDNLWANTFGFYTYLVTLGSWYLLHDIGMMAEPQQYIIFAISCSALVISYGIRKLGWR
jgi:hypothetical protein